jgi:hypothetical protein
MMMPKGMSLAGEGQSRQRHHSASRQFAKHALTPRNFSEQVRVLDICKWADR